MMMMRKRGGGVVRRRRDDRNRVFPRGKIERWFRSPATLPVEAEEAARKQRRCREEEREGGRTTIGEEGRLVLRGGAVCCCVLLKTRERCQQERDDGDDAEEEEDEGDRRQRRDDGDDESMFFDDGRKEREREREREDGRRERPSKKRRLDGGGDGFLEDVGVVVGVLFVAAGAFEVVEGSAEVVLGEVGEHFVEVALQSGLAIFGGDEERGDEVDGEAVAEDGLDEGANDLEVHPRDEGLGEVGFGPPQDRRVQTIDFRGELVLVSCGLGDGLGVVRKGAHDKTQFLGRHRVRFDEVDVRGRLPLVVDVGTGRLRAFQ
mmetsp:Transcript_27613/g.84726  ORF Transcript_27613/g.84726 Transcript_27613/m.84726 type:complete len:319 (-) Transcript_27613:105-1061(-)